jgi:GNAT superfamily N-acetyltransferase
VAIIDPEPGSRLARVPGVFEVGAVEVAAGWRRRGIGSALLRFAVAAEPFRDLVLVAFGLAWHWDLEGSGLTAMAYRRGLLRSLETAGFEELATDDPEIAYDPANLFAARVGDRVPPERRALFTGRLVRGGSRSSSR